MGLSCNLIFCSETYYFLYFLVINENFFIYAQLKYISQILLETMNFCKSNDILTHTSSNKGRLSIRVFLRHLKDPKRFFEFLWVFKWVLYLFMSGNLPQDLFATLLVEITILEGWTELEKQNNKKGKHLDLVYETEEKF